MIKVHHPLSYLSSWLFVFWNGNSPFNDQTMFDQENMQRQMESSQEAIAQRMDFSQVPLGFPSLDAMENPGENPMDELMSTGDTPLHFRTSPNLSVGSGLFHVFDAYICLGVLGEITFDGWIMFVDRFFL